jgi:hypothetical protein
MNSLKFPSGGVLHGLHLFVNLSGNALEPGDGR